jgi:Mg2+/Co2+ transporter CorC
MASYQITQETWLARAASRVGSVLTAQMKHNEPKTQAELVELIKKSFPENTFSNDELTTIRARLILDGVIEEV